ncbi:MAG: radical SAM protein [Deltaproteobacteria bacterium]|nr:radical SAM protein [Deltaproteobacteria bacterium]
MTRSPTIPDRPVPLVCVWELTLACNAACEHCGSDAGHARSQELSTKEALDVVAQLAGMGCTIVTLSGGEPLLRHDWFEIAVAIRSAGMKIDLITNGLAACAQAERIGAAGFESVSFSIDGPPEVHDSLRGAGALRRALDGAAALRRQGVRIGAVTQVNQRNLGELSATHDLLAHAHFEGWQIQLTLPTGRTPKSICLGPEAIAGLEEQVVRAVSQGRMHVIAADTIGWYGRNEPLLRTGNRSGTKVWAACQAGLQAVAITSDGTVRGCLAMPAEFDEGNLRSQSLATIWSAPGAFSYNRGFERASLRGACASCELGGICRAGCTCMAWLATGTTVDNPYCTRLQVRT